MAESWSWNLSDTQVLSQGKAWRWGGKPTRQRKTHVKRPYGKRELRTTVQLRKGEKIITDICA